MVNRTIGASIPTIAIAGLAILLLTAAGGGVDSPCGDVNKSGEVKASDALAVLRFAVGQPVDLYCKLTGGLPATGQTTAQGAESDGDVRAGVARSFTDNGDGTITDNATGLMWEKKDDVAGIHWQHGTYTWSTGNNTMDGTIVTEFLATLNSGSGFANHKDWRIPNLNELETLRNLEASNPATFSEFHTDCASSCTVATCSCTTANFYWSSSTYDYNVTYAWGVYFFDGIAYQFLKNAGFARAVRDIDD